MKRRSTKSAIGFCFSVIVSVAAATSSLQASFRQTWSAIGAVGVPDELSLGLLNYSDTGSVSIKSGIASATAQLRYQVVPVGDMLQTANEMGGAWGLRVLYRDPGSTARVIVSVKSVNVFTGAVTTYATFDSDASATFLTGDQYMPMDMPLRNPDGTRLESFFTYGQAYYVDVKLIKTASTGNPGVKAIQIFNENS